MIDVRDFVRGDTPALLSLVRGFFRLHRQFLGGRDLLADAEAEEILQEMLHQPHSWLVVAEDKDTGEIAGFARWEEREGAFFGRELFVRPERRGQGIGSSLQESVEDRVRQAGGDALFISVVPHNRLMLAFAHQHGYDTLNTIELRKELAGERPRRGQVTLFGIDFKTI